MAEQNIRSDDPQSPYFQMPPGAKLEPYGNVWAAFTAGKPTGLPPAQGQELRPTPPNPTPWEAAKILAGRVGESMLSAFSLPHDVAAGKIDPTSSEGIRRAADLAATVGTGAMPLAEPGAAGIFGGRLARTAEHGRLGDAMRGELGGVRPEDLHKRTGWFRGPDDKWRFEISDRGSALNHNTLESVIESRAPGAATKLSLGDILHHPDLYRAYPELANMPVEIKPMKKQWTGAYVPSIDSIELNSKLLHDSAELHNTLLHEVQHAVQMREEFTGGGSPSSSAAETAVPPEVAHEFRSTQDKIEKFNELMNRYIQERSKTEPYDASQFMREFPHLKDALNELFLRRNTAYEIEQRARRDAYHRFAGEVEARNVEKRQLFTTQERTTLPPWRTQDVPYGQQIILGFEDLVPTKLTFDDLIPGASK